MNNFNIKINKLNKIIINEDETYCDENAELVFHEDIQKVFSKIKIPKNPL